MSDVELDRFDRDDAWKLGVHLVEVAREQHLPLAIGIWIGEHRVFAAGLPGSVAMNDRWAVRKANVARHFERPSVEVFEVYASALPDFYERFGLTRSEYAASEGAVPLRVGGAVVAIVSASGIDGGGDHDFVMSALDSWRRAP